MFHLLKLQYKKKGKDLILIDKDKKFEEVKCVDAEIQTDIVAQQVPEKSEHSSQSGSGSGGLSNASYDVNPEEAYQRYEELNDQGGVNVIYELSRDKMIQIGVYVDIKKGNSVLLI